MHISLGLIITAALPAFAATAAQWRSRSIYQVMTDRFARTDQSTTATCDTSSRVYCGGTWQGLIHKLDYIQNMGFTAIWISPIDGQLPQMTAYGEAFHGYWQQNINALNAHFGTADDLHALSNAVHARGMYLMVDIVVNHFGYAGDPTQVNYASFSPFNSQSYFHPYCPITNWDYSSNQTGVEDCWLGDRTVSLPDLNTTHPFVINTYYSWIKNLVSTYSIDGLRIDTLKHVQKDFWPGFNQAAGVYCVGEVFDGDSAYTCNYQNYVDGILNYPLYFPLTRAFQSTSGSISDLVNGVNAVKNSCKDTSLLGTFLENQDNPRLPSYTNDLSLDKNAIAFTILADGIPIIYEGQEQHYSGGSDPANREAIWLSGYSTASPLYGLIAAVNNVRNLAIWKSANYLTYMAYPIYADGSTIAMRKGYNGNQVVGVFNNQGANGGSYTLNLGNTGYTSGMKVVEILSCTAMTVDGNGNLAVAMSQGLPKIFYPAAQMAGSGLCKY